MNKRLFSIILSFVLTLGVVFPGQALAEVTLGASAKSVSISNKGVSPTGILNADGTLKLNGSFKGNIDLSGYHVQLDPNLGPVFSSASSVSNTLAPAALTPGTWSGVGSGGGTVDGRVDGMAVYGSNVYVVGEFTNVDNISAADYVAKWNGSQWSALGSNGSGGGAITSYAYAVAVDGSGNVYVGGYFANVYNGSTYLPAASKIAKWDGTNWSALGSNGAGGGAISNGTVTAIAISGSNVYVGGSFTDVNNNGAVLTAADDIAKWDGTNWYGLGNDGGGTPNGSLNGEVNAIVISGSNVYVGGSFTDVNNGGAVLTAADYVAKWDGANWSALGSDGGGSPNGSLNSAVYALALDGSGNLYVGGGFTDVNNSGAVLSNADYIAKWDGANWSALGSNGAGNGSLNGYVDAILISGTNIYMGGGFTNVNNNGTVLNTADYVTKWDGTNWSALGSNGAGDGAIPLKYTAGVLSFALSGSKLFVGGWFYDVNNNGMADFLAQWNGSSWSSVGSDSNGALVNGYTGSYVDAIAVSGTNMYVGGYFQIPSNHGINNPQMNYIAKWDGMNWSALGSNGSGGASLSGPVHALALDNAGNLYVGGDFTNVNNNGTVLTAADYIAKWDGTNWSALGSDGGGTPNGSLNNGVHAIAISGSNVYVGGYFTDVNNGGTVLTAADYVAKWDGANWSALGSDGGGTPNGSLNGPVMALALDGFGNLCVGGGFTSVNNNGSLLNTAAYIVKWNGANWSALGSNGAGSGSLNNWVFAIATNGADVYAGGSFTDVNDNGTVLTAADFIAKWDGANWSALGSNGFSNGAVQSRVNGILVNGNDVYVGGDFTYVNNNGTILHAAGYAARWDGTNWHALGTSAQTLPSLNNYVNEFALYGSDLLVGGYFTDVKNLGTTTIKEADYLAAYGLVPQYGPTLNGPSNGITLINNRPQFSWSVYPTATSYQLQVAKDNLFKQIVLKVTIKGAGNLVYTPKADLPANMPLYSRVEAVLGNATTPWSSISTFTTAFPPTIPVPVVPANKALILTTTPIMYWSASAAPLGAPAFYQYQLQISTSTDFSSPLIDINLATAIINLASPPSPVASLNTATSYYWRVRGWNVGYDSVAGNGDDQVSDWSTVYLFKVGYPAPTLGSPADTATGVALKPSFTWSAASGSGITSYTIQVSKFSNFSTRVINATVPGTSYNDTTITLSSLTIYYWRVRANGTYGPGAWSGTYSFTTQ